jgi:hypothetical protein
MTRKLTTTTAYDNAGIRASLVGRAEQWRWSSASRVTAGMPLFDPDRVARPQGWLEHVNEPQTVIWMP